MDQLKHKIKAFIDDKHIENKRQLEELIDDLDSEDLKFIDGFLCELNFGNNKHYIIDISRDGQSIAIETRCSLRKLYQ